MMKETEVTEKEIRVVVDGKELLKKLTVQELSFLLYVYEDLFSSDTVKELQKQELKIEGIAKGQLLDMLEIIWIDDKTKANKGKREVAKSLYDKLYLASKEEVYHIRRTIIESKSFLSAFRLSELSWN